MLPTIHLERAPPCFPHPLLPSTPQHPSLDHQVDRLATLLRDKKIGVVAHFYMDPQVQGVLTSAAQQWPHIHISDSLVMADSAVRMAEAGCTTVAVLGVDFMSENVRAILDEAGWTDVKVCVGWVGGRGGV